MKTASSLTFSAIFVKPGSSPCFSATRTNDARTAQQVSAPRPPGRACLKVSHQHQTPQYKEKAVTLTQLTDSSSATSACFSFRQHDRCCACLPCTLRNAPDNVHGWLPRFCSLSQPTNQIRKVTVPDKPAKFGPFLGLTIDDNAKPPSRRRGGNQEGSRWIVSPVRPRLAACLELRLSSLRVIIPGRGGYERDLLKHLGEDTPDQVGVVTKKAVVLLYGLLLVCSAGRGIMARLADASPFSIDLRRLDAAPRTTVANPSSLWSLRTSVNSCRGLLVIFAWRRWLLQAFRRGRYAATDVPVVFSFS